MTYNYPFNDSNYFHIPQDRGKDRKVTAGMHGGG